MAEITCQRKDAEDADFSPAMTSPFIGIESMVGELIKVGLCSNTQQMAEILA